MTQTTHPRAGWQQDEIDVLFAAVREAAQSGKPLRDVFADVGVRLSRKPNSIRNFYYARVHEEPELAARQTPFRAFTPEELNSLLRSVLIGRGQGESVRACVTRLAEGDRAGMLRYQNKYRSILKNRPEMLQEIAQELRAEGLPCPENVVACRRYERAPKGLSSLNRLERHMGDPTVRRMVEGLNELLERAQSRAQEEAIGEAMTEEAAEPVVPYQKWAEARREADRLKVEVDLLKMELEDAKG